MICSMRGLAGGAGTFLASATRGWVLRWLPLATILLVAGLNSSSAFAVPAAATWKVETLAQPTQFAPADGSRPGCTEVANRTYKNTACDRYTIVLVNVGTRTTGGTITVRDVLPEGLTTIHLPGGEDELTEFEWGCETERPAAREIVTCTSNSSVPALTAAPAIEIPVAVAPAAGPVVNEVEVSGGGVESATLSTSTPIGSPPEPFGVLGFDFASLDQAGHADTQAASHPGSFTAAFHLPTANGYNGLTFQPFPVEGVKQIVTDVPAGVIGDALATPTCPLADLASLTHAETQCPASTRIGKLVLFEAQGVNSELKIFNVTPERGYPAEFGVFLPSLERSALLYATVVGSGADTHVRIISSPQSEAIFPVGISLTIFGNPAAIDGTSLEPVAFATNPSDCAAPGFTATMYVDSWQTPGKVEADGQPDLADPNWKRASATLPAVTGCEALKFHPTLTFGPEPGHSQADEPAGYESTLRIPQNEDPNGLATPPLKNTVVTLPAGVAISPSAANGLQGCEPGATGIGLENDDLGHCPGASKVGEVKAITPLLSEPLEGGVYVAQPDCSPCSEAQAEKGEVFALYLELGSEKLGVHVKLEGKVEVGGAGHNNDLQPGQARTTFAQTPQDPVSELELSFDGGPRAPLANPQSCGTFSTEAELEAWSHTPAAGEGEGTPNVTLTPSFAIGGCSNGFAPAFSAGTVNNQAGGYSGFTTTFSRQDGEQDLGGVKVTLPPGLIGKIAGIAQCGETEANSGSCAPASAVGTVTAAAGSGPDPYWQSGRVYLTGPYRGAPFGLSIVVPAVAGPYNLGDIVVRAAIYVDPATAQVTVVSDPLPQSVDGVPLRVKTVNVTVGAESKFTFNPTSCIEQSVAATITSVQGASSIQGSRFQAANCGSLPFTPSLTASTQGKASKVDGASLVVKIAAKPGEANIAKTELQFPHQLPARNSTLQKACLQVQFALNPAGCPAGSIIGMATIRTPVLNVPLTGPMYLVSHGGATFPDVEVVLQGENVEIVLDGKTDIKKGVTYSRFETVPDAPFTSFEADLMEGPHSIFGVYLPHEGHNLCGQALKLPTKLVGQNGAVIEKSTSIAVSGCSHTLSISSHSVSKRVLSLSIYAPAAGRVKVSGAGLGTVTKDASGQETVVVRLTQKEAGRRSAKVSVSFQPRHGRKQAKSLSVKFTK